MLYYVLANAGSAQIATNHALDVPPRSDSTLIDRVGPLLHVTTWLRQLWITTPNHHHDFHDTVGYDARPAISCSQVSTPPPALTIDSWLSLQNRGAVPTVTKCRCTYEYLLLRTWRAECGFVHCFAGQPCSTVLV